MESRRGKSNLQILTYLSKDKGIAHNWKKQFAARLETQ
jgi:hypothetical protein